MEKDDLLTDTVLLLYLLEQNGILQPVSNAIKDLEECCFYRNQLRQLVNKHCVVTGKKPLFE